ncbi:MAG: CapA family protein, partial [candidate division WOR-3 bacterium]
LFCQKSGVNIAFLACCDRNGQYDNYQPFLDAGLNKPGFAYLDSFRVRRAIGQVKELADIVVVEMHTGEEYEARPEDQPGNDELQVTSDESIKGDEMYSRFALFPAPNDTAERHRAIEAGADLVVCHHPHVLQGFEIYQGKLIAHSLGNYAFDLAYPETYPTVIRSALVDERGPYEYTVVPVYIDDWIPRPATGELGQHILDYLAQRSRELGTLLIVSPDSLVGHIVLDTAGLARLVRSCTTRVQVRPESGAWVSAPMRLPRQGSLSRIVQAGPGTDWQFRVGRELVWFGGFEDEGASMWLLDNADEFYDTVACRGSRSLCQVRRQGAGRIVTNLEKRLPARAGVPHTVFASVCAENAESAAVEFRSYSSRSGGTMLAGYSTGTVRGTSEWTGVYADFTTVSQTSYFDVVLRSRGPQAGDGRTWFDDVSVVEWGSWQELSSPMPVTEPNDIYWLQVRTGVSTPEVTVVYEETRYDAPVPVQHQASTVPRPYCRILPNPARTDLRIEYHLATPARAMVKVFDATGREVRQLVESETRRGTQSLVWDRKDNSGHRLTPGTYFCRFVLGSTHGTVKLVLVE